MNKYFPNSNSRNFWVNRCVTLLDCSRILKHIQLDLGKICVSPDILHKLYLLISGSKKFLSEKIPDYVVTMNSDIILQFERNQQKRIRIVYPDNIKFPYDTSIYSPVAIACLGSFENSVVYFNDESGFNRAFIKKIVFQPEKEKLFHL
jgi:hypothetical protein